MKARDIIPGWPRGRSTTVAFKSYGWDFVTDYLLEQEQLSESAEALWRDRLEVGKWAGKVYLEVFSGPRLLGKTCAIISERKVYKRILAIDRADDKNL